MSKTNKANNVSTLAAVARGLSYCPKLSYEFLKLMYENRCSNQSLSSSPVLQILAFEESLHEPHS